MAAIAGFFLLASFVVVILALFRRSPVRKWYASRQHPGRAVGLSLIGWFVVFIFLLAMTPTSPREASTDEAAGHAHTAPTSTVQPSPTGTTTTHTTVMPTTPNGVPKDAQEARTRRIIDGDTLELAAVRTGAVLSSTTQVDARLLEIDAPETNHPNEPEQCYGQQATGRLTELAPPGSTVWVQRDDELRDQYGRHLLYLWNDDGVFVNLEMVKGGYAQPTLYQPNDLHWPKISAAGQQGRSAGAGLWAACPYFGAPKETPKPKPAPLPTPEPEPAPEREPAGVSYPYPPDLDCSQIDERNFQVQEGDPHGFDGNGDGIGCED